MSPQQPKIVSLYSVVTATLESANLVSEDDQCVNHCRKPEVTIRFQ